jgi:hypothetical protein
MFALKVALGSGKEPNAVVAVLAPEPVCKAHTKETFYASPRNRTQIPWWSSPQPRHYTDLYAQQITLLLKQLVFYKCNGRLMQSP